MLRIFTLTLTLAVLLALSPIVGPTREAVLSGQQSLAGDIHAVDGSFFNEVALGERLFANNQIRNSSSFPMIRKIAAALVISSVPLWAADAIPSHSPQVYIDFAYVHLRWGIGIMVSDRIKTFLAAKYELGHLAQVISIIAVLISGFTLVTSAINAWPPLKYAAQAVIEFFMNHTNVSLLLDEGLLIILGLAIWQKLNPNKWPRVVASLPLDESVFRKFAYFRQTGFVNYFVLAYGIYKLHREILYYLPVWALTTFLFHEFDRRWLGREMRRHLRSDLNSITALSIEGGIDTAPSIVLWEKEVDFLKIGGLLFPCLDYIVPWNNWGPLRERLRNMFRHSSPAKNPIPEAVPYGRLAVRLA